MDRAPCDALFVLQFDGAMEPIGEVALHLGQKKFQLVSKFGEFLVMLIAALAIFEVLEVGVEMSADRSDHGLGKLAILRRPSRIRGDALKAVSSGDPERRDRFERRDDGRKDESLPTAYGNPSVPIENMCDSLFVTDGGFWRWAGWRLLSISTPSRRRELESLASRHKTAQGLAQRARKSARLSLISSRLTRQASAGRVA